MPVYKPEVTKWVRSFGSRIDCLRAEKPIEEEWFYLELILRQFYQIYSNFSAHENCNKIPFQ